MMGSVLVSSQNTMEETPFVGLFPTMPVLQPQQPVPGGAPADPDLAYLQEKLLRDEWLKLMSYSKKKKKKKKKEKDKEKCKTFTDFEVLEEIPNDWYSLLYHCQSSYINI